MGGSKSSKLPEPTTEEILPLGIRLVTPDTRNRCQFPTDFRWGAIDFKVHLCYINPPGKAIVVFDKSKFLSMYPGATLEEVDINGQGKITFPKAFLELNDITLYLNKRHIVFVSREQDGNSVVEIYFSHDLFKKDVAQTQAIIANRATTIIATPPCTITGTLIDATPLTTTGTA